MAWPSSLSAVDRVARATVVVEQLVDNVRELIALSEANRYIIYRPTLASQIPTSYAANAFNLFQWSALNYEILRACSVWDSCARDRVSIPTLVELVNCSTCLEVIEENLRRAEGSKKASEILARLRRTISIAEQVQRATFKTALFNFRNSALAHTLHLTSQSPPSKLPKYGYERRLLRASIAIVWNMNSAIRGSDFMFDMAIEQSQRNAKALWEGCTFNVLE